MEAFDLGNRLQDCTQPFGLELQGRLILRRGVVIKVRLAVCIVPRNVRYTNYEVAYSRQIRLADGVCKCTP